MSGMFENPVDKIIEGLDLENDDKAERTIIERIEAYHGLGFTRTTLQRALMSYRFTLVQIVEGIDVQPHEVGRAKDAALATFKSEIAGILAQRDTNQGFLEEIGDIVGGLMQKVVTDIDAAPHSFSREEIEEASAIVLKDIDWEKEAAYVAAQIAEKFPFPAVANMYFFEKRTIFQAYKDDKSEANLFAVKDVVAQYFYYNLARESK